MRKVFAHYVKWKAGLWSIMMLSIVGLGYGSTMPPFSSAIMQKLESHGQFEIPLVLFVWIVLPLIAAWSLMLAKNIIFEDGEALWISGRR